MYTKIRLSDSKIVPKSGLYKIFSNHFWIVSEDDCILHISGSALCSKNKAALIKHLTDKNNPGVKIKFIAKPLFIPQTNHY